MIDQKNVAAIVVSTQIIDKRREVGRWTMEKFLLCCFCL